MTERNVKISNYADYNNSSDNSNNDDGDNY